MDIKKLWEAAVESYAELPFLGLWRGQDAPYLPWSYAQTDARVRALRLWLAEAGLTAGDRVALWSGNQPGWGALALAVQSSDLVFVPFLPDFPVRDVARCLRHAEAKVLVLGSTWKETWSTWIACPQNDQEGESDRLWASGLQVRVLEDFFDSKVSDADPSGTDGANSRDFPPPEESHPASLLYTSGTTGTPKGVLLTHGNLVSNVLAARKIARIVPGDRLLSVLPLAHAYEGTLGFLIPMVSGGHITYLAKPPSPTVLLPALADVRPHLMLTVPLFIEKVVKQKVLPVLDAGVLGLLRRVPGLGRLVYLLLGLKLRRLFGGRIRFFGVGGAQLAPEVEALLRKARFPYAIGYGLTETSPLVAGTYSLLGRRFSTGPALEGVEIRIDHDHDASGSGEIQVRGPNIFDRYWKDEERTREAFTNDGWFRTGDLGSLGRSGHLFIKGRSKNVILGPNGENVYPEAIEALLNQSRLVSESLVVARGRELVAKVVFNSETLHEAVQTWLRHKGEELSQWSRELSDVVSAYVQQYLKDLLEEVNRKLVRGARLSALEWHDAPFEKTATMKIKRFLYA